MAPGQKADFYVHGHPDDWQLFMGDRVNNSVQSGNYVVLVYTTAGDAGSAQSNPDYWQTRERGAQASVDVIVPTGSWACAAQVVNAHSMQRCVKGPVVSYYMRMPDGNVGGGGYGYGSLDGLRDADTDTRAVDGSTTYTSWADFTATLRGIIDSEGSNQGAPYVAVHAPDHDRAINPGDHSDHFATADAVGVAASGRSWDLLWYVDYATASLPVNLSEADIAVKDAEFLAYDRVVGVKYESYAGNDAYADWRRRTYLRAAGPPPPPAKVARVDVSPSSTTLARSETQQLTATPRDERGAPLSGRAVTWTSSDPAVATVTAAGLVTGVAAGPATITATVEGVPGTASIAVVTPPTALTGVGRTIPTGQQVTLSWTRGTTTAVDIYRNSAPIRTGFDGGTTYVDEIVKKGRGGNYTYQVCLTGRTGAASCSNSATVNKF